jgi:hypothetical protein
MLWLSVALAAVAVVLPISTVSDLIKPDERLVAHALLLAVAALPYHAVRRTLAALGPVLAAAVLPCTVSSTCRSAADRRVDDRPRVDSWNRCRRRLGGRGGHDRGSFPWRDAMWWRVCARRR